MSIQNNDLENEYQLPASIELLFENTKLEILKTMVILKVFYNKSKRKFLRISEICFYYGLNNFNLYPYPSSNNTLQSKSISSLFRYESKVHLLILELAGANHIEVKGNLTDKTQDLQVRLTDKGAEFLSELRIEYLEILNKNYSNVIDQEKYSKEKYKKIKGI